MDLKLKKLEESFVIRNTDKKNIGVDLNYIVEQSADYEDFLKNYRDFQNKSQQMDL